jgi:hypothetical protein
VYNVAGGKSLPEWLSDKKREALRKDEEFRRRIELIQARSRRPRRASCAAEQRGQREAAGCALAPRGAAAGCARRGRPAACCTSRPSSAPQCCQLLHACVRALSCCRAPRTTPRRSWTSRARPAA